MVMDIVDAQLHIGPEPFEATLAEMDRLGIRSVLVDEFWVSRRVSNCVRISRSLRLKSLSRVNFIF
jgi:hypothetical protein